MRKQGPPAKDGGAPMDGAAIHIDGPALRAARERSWLTQHQLAERFGVADRTITYWEAKGVPSRRARVVAQWMAETPSWRQLPAGGAIGDDRLSTLLTMRASLVATLAMLDAQIAAESVRAAGLTDSAGTAAPSA